MGRVWAVIKREYLERVRSKWFLIATVFGPLFFGALMVVPAWLGIRSARETERGQVTIIDATGTPLGERIAERLRGGLFGDTSAARVVRVDPSSLAAAESIATQSVMRKDVTGFLVLGPTALRDTSIRYAGRNAASIPEVDRIERAVRDALLSLRLEEQGVNSELVLRVMKLAMSVEPEQITERGRGGSGRIQFLFAATVALVLYMTILVHGLNVMRSVLEEKTTRVAEVVVASIRPDALLAGKIIGVGGVAVTQVAAWILTSALLMRFRQPISAALGLPSLPITLPSVTPGVLLLLIVFFLLGFLLFAALYAIVGAMVSSEQEAQQASQPLMLVVLSPLFLLQAVLFNPATQVARATSMIPFAAPVLMPLRLSLVPVPAWEIALSLGLNAVACIAVMWVAARVYRVGILMYGKRATVGEVFRWVRQG